MKLTWVNNNFICKGLYAPFVVNEDRDYLKDLRRKYKLILDQARLSGADQESLKILNKYRTQVLQAVNAYYNADVARCNAIILGLVSDIGNEEIAVSDFYKCYAFKGNGELQLFRSRSGNPAKGYTAKDMLHLPQRMRAKAGNYRFSIPGNPGFYLANSSYGCWIETGCPGDSEFNVSPVLLDGTQRIFNLAVSMRDMSALNECEEGRVHCWLKLIMLCIATSYRIEEPDRTYKSEYIVSQSIMIACKKLHYDGVAYYSKRVSDEIFAFCAINLALFIQYKGEYSELVKHMIMDDLFNFALYKKLRAPQVSIEYELRSTRTGLITNIGTYEKQFSYRETDFYKFDQFLFASWNRDRRKDENGAIHWGVKV